MGRPAASAARRRHRGALLLPPRGRADRARLRAAFARAHLAARWLSSAVLRPPWLPVGSRPGIEGREPAGAPPLAAVRIAARHASGGGRVGSGIRNEGGVGRAYAEKFPFRPPPRRPSERQREQPQARRESDG